MYIIFVHVVPILRINGNSSHSPACIMENQNQMILSAKPIMDVRKYGGEKRYGHEVNACSRAYVRAER